MSLLVYLILLAGNFMGFCHLNHMVILKLLLLGIVNKLPNFKVSSSMIKKVYRDALASAKRHTCSA